jgi:hypothetical protein
MTGNRASGSAASPLEAGWRSYLETLAEIPSRLNLDLPADDPLLSSDALHQLVAIAAQAYPVMFSQDARHPQLVPFTSPVFRAGTNPDFNYLYAALDGRSSYRLSGDRGSSLFVHFVQNSGMLGLDEQPGPPLATLDLDTLEVAGDGAFSVLLAPRRPDDYSGDWWRLDQRATSITIRQASYDWVAERDGRFALECLDPVALPEPEHPGPATRQLDQIGRFAVRYVNALGHMRRALAGLPPNVLQLNAWSQYGGLPNQYYYQGRFDLADHETLILETSIPQRVRYWGIALLDEIFNALDWTVRQSSLNGHQACIDADGRFRAVISIADPGVPNWLDPGGRRRGLVQGRWFDSDSGPVPMIRRVQLRDLREHLPPDTRVIDADERAAQLRQRSRGAQLRRKW